MFGNVNCFYLYVIVVTVIIITCACEPQTPYLALYGTGDTEHTDVLVRRVHDNLTLVCEVRGDPAARVFVWNYVSDNGTDGGRPLVSEPSGPTIVSRLERGDLQLSDSGHYICSAPPFSSTKYVLVQTKGPHQCARGAFWCGARCVLPAYVCDGRKDCVLAEDEAPPLCAPRPCARGDKLNCSSGRCIPEAACCRPGAALCRQPACCDEHSRFSTLEGYVEVEYPPLFDDRHAPDEYGFIQSTIYTVTACALIFMIAVVLLVSALCKMHMKRAALRGYASAHRDTAHHYAARFPPRYEAARLLEPGAAASPVRGTYASTELPSPESPSTVASEPPEPPPYSGGFGLARLSAIFCSRYRQVPTQCCDVELRPVRGAGGVGGAGGPPRAAPPAYRSPARAEPELYYADPELAPQELNYMAAPLDFFCRRTARRNTIDRVLEQLSAAQRPLTLQLGRFQLSLPRFRRESPRPDTPDVGELAADELRDTYTLNGRTIALLGADLEHFPPRPGRPPPYNEAMRYKYGPPPDYLSRERIDSDESEARSNVEMPPRYEELAAGADRNANVATVAPAAAVATVADVENGNVATGHIAETNALYDADSVNGCTAINDNDLFVSAGAYPETIRSVIDNLPAIDCDVNANDGALSA
ncbi:uncharacterized protein LOC112049649 [Bicyclus anynana]|uniref:Uncharacterized protein LOC112049649 n=1 Tax=Bicyclus anynana TaxID=110368 RepID=A0ABM3LJD3_BICAN|nr:uncharacterized protein LOC112049649 [Bicyclus anynana]